MMYSTGLLIIIGSMHCVSMLIRPFISQEPICDNYNEKYVRNFTMSFKNKRMNLELDLVSTLSSGLRLNMEFFIRKSNAKSFQSFYQYSLNICSTLRNPKAKLLMQWVSTFKSHSNFVVKCPIPNGHYSVKDYNAAALHIPSFFTPGLYRTSITFKLCKKDLQELVIDCRFYLDLKNGSPQ